MITSGAWRGKRYAVLGLARSGRATVEALLASGAEVMAWDENEAARAAFSPSPRLRGEGRGEGESGDFPLTPPLPTLSPEGERALCVADPMTTTLEGYDAIVVSPGVPLNRHPIAQRAREAGVPIIGDIELFAQARAELPPHKAVGITGTNGKSTTTALVHHILKTAGVPTTMGGNIGLPILAQEPLPESGVYVLELSSYQIDLTQSLDCDVAVLLNITPDHLDRYESFEAYAASKARLFELQSAEHNAFLVLEDEQSRKLMNRLSNEERPTKFLGSLPISRFGVASLDLLDSDNFDQSVWLALQGPHNAQNAAAAIEVCINLGLVFEAIVQGLRTYPGLPHRMERVAERGGVLFVNDSKATNPTSTSPALAAYSSVHWILGGQAKSEDLDACAPWFGHVRGAYTIGEAGPMFARLLADKVPSVEQSETLDRAVTAAAARAKAGEVVLLSPACASFDQFTDYEARGDAFRAAVGAL